MRPTFVRLLVDDVVAGPLDRPTRRIRVAYLRDPAGSLLELNRPMPTEE